MRRSAGIAVLALTVAAVGCSRATDDLGLDALLRISGAQFYRGALSAAGDGPAVSSFMTSSSIIRPGQTNAPLSGVVTRDTTAVAVYLDGDPGYWIITPGAEDATQLDQLTFGARLSFSPLLPAGMYTLVGRAADAQARFGPPTKVVLQTADLPTGETLVVSLRWDSEADLDLHVVTPGGVEIWANKINSYTPPAPGQPMDPNGYQAGGILDFDSNANCNIDGRRLENVFWTQPPPSGHYVVRIDTYSLCGQPEANWHVGVTLGDATVGEAFGWGRDSDAMLPHGAGSGVTALGFDVP